MGTSDPYTNPRRGPIPIKRKGFGQRVRAARAYAGGITRAQLAGRIESVFQGELPKSGVSSTTIKRLEAGESVRGEIKDWAQRVSIVTNVPEWFLLGDWEGAAAVIRDAPFDDRQSGDETKFLEALAGEISAATASIQRLVHAQRERQGMQQEWFLRELPGLLRVARPAVFIDMTRESDRGAKAMVDILLDRTARGALAEQMLVIQDELDSRDPEAVQQALAHAQTTKQSRPQAGGEAAQRILPFPSNKLNASLLLRYLNGQYLSAEETIDVHRMVNDADVRHYLQSIVEARGVSETAPTPRSAADAPLPEPPGELGRRAREHLPTPEDREREQTPEEQGAQPGTGR